MSDRVGSGVARPDRCIARRAFMTSLCAATAGVALTTGRSRADSGRLPPQIMWTAADLQPLVGTWFEVIDGGSRGSWLRLESVEVVGRPRSGGPRGRAAFSMVFTGRPDGPRDQATYRMRHPVTGDVELLLAPVDRPGAVPRLEAVVG